MTTQEIFTKNFRKIKKENGLTQKEIANELLVDRSTVALWAKGKLFPRPFNIDCLCSLFNVSVEDFFKR